MPEILDDATRFDSMAVYRLSGLKLKAEFVIIFFFHIVIIQQKKIWNCGTSETELQNLILFFYTKNYTVQVGGMLIFKSQNSEIQ